MVGGTCVHTDIFGIVLDMIPATANETKEILEQIQEIVGAVWLTVPCAAKMLEVDKHKLYDAIATEELQSYKIGPRSIRIKKSDLDHWVETNPFNL
jgi:excisionase family DNA binding protein